LPFRDAAVGVDAEPAASYRQAMDRNVTDTLEHLAFRAARAGLAGLPYGAAELCLRGLARVAADGFRLRRDVTDRQLAEVYGDLDDRERRRLRRGVYDHLGRMAAEVFLADPQSLADAVRLEPGFDPLDRALAGGRGAIVVTAHFGNFELAGRILAARYPLLDVVKPQRNPAVERELTALRRRHGIATVPMEHAGRAVLAHLRRGGLVSLLIDQDAGASGVSVPFLGRPASTWPGAARIALRTGCPVVPVAIVRDGEGHVFHIGEALAPPADPKADEAVAAYMAAMTRSLERWIRTCPDQWFWVHRRWKGAALAQASTPLRMTTGISI